MLPSWGRNSLVVLNIDILVNADTSIRSGCLTLFFFLSPVSSMIIKLTFSLQVSNFTSFTSWVSEFWYLCGMQFTLILHFLTCASLRWPLPGEQNFHGNNYMNTKTNSLSHLPLSSFQESNSNYHCFQIKSLCVHK